MMFSTSGFLFKPLLNPKRTQYQVINPERVLDQAVTLGRWRGLVPLDSPITRAKEEEYYDALREREKAGNAYIQANGEHSGVQNIENLTMVESIPNWWWNKGNLFKQWRCMQKDIIKYDDVAIHKKEWT